MACLLIVDDDSDNAMQLADVITAGSPCSHQIVCTNGLADFRQIRRQCKPDLVLVELLRHQSNGFTLAAALARQSSAPVVLLTDRDLASDQLWASARGIRYVLCRRAGPAVLVQQIDSLLRNEVLRATGDELVWQSEPVLLSKSLMAELTIEPEKALLSCLHEELCRLPCEHPGHRLDVATSASRPLLWLEHLLCYMPGNDIRDAMQALIRELHKRPQQSRQEPDLHAWVHARESLLVLLEPDANSILLEQCKESWAQICQLLPADFEAVASSDHSAACADQRLRSGTLRCSIEVLNAMTFLPGLQAAARAIELSAETCDLSVVEYIHGQLDCVDTRDELQQLMTTECLRVLGSSIPGNKLALKTAWRDLAGLCLMLRSIAVQQHWQAILDRCVKVMYGWTNNMCQGGAEQLLTLTLNMLDRATVQKEMQKEVQKKMQGAEYTGLPAEIARKLCTALADVATMLEQKAPLHQRLSHLMVSVYKLRSWLEFSVTSAELVNEPIRRWQLVTGCLYELVCHGVLQAGLLTQADIGDLRKFVIELQNCIQQEVSPSENTLMNLMALEITIARRSQCGYGQAHQLLAAGLQRLPKPDRILSDIVDDVKLSGTVLSEITHELRVLTEGAQSLGVGRVESLARLMLDCYQQLGRQPGLLQQKARRLSLGRAHRTLCRLLDQAAAWLPLDQTGAGLSVPQVIDDLFTQFDHSRQQATTVVTVGEGAASPEARQAAWVQCQSLNRRLRQIIRRSDNLSDYRSLMVELLQEQQAVITPHLPYQMPR